MAISYLSTPFKSSPYELPLDLNLFSKVLSIKQEQFDKAGQKIQSDIDQLGSLDVLKTEDRDYLNGKINNLVGSLNTYGGVDLSDQSVSTQIEGLGSDIYSDDKVLSALASTKKVRNLMSSYEKFKTDPKLSKLYSQVNEAFDMQNVNAYMNDKNVGSSYSGPSDATPYVAYRDAHYKLFDKIKSDLTTNIMQNGYYITKESGERISPDRIMAIAADNMLPQEREQMKRDAWFLYRGADPSSLMQKGEAQYQTKVDDAVRLQREYEDLAAQAVNDPQARKNYNTLADQQAKVVSSIASAKSQFSQNFGKSLQSNPDEVYYNLYADDYFRGLGNRFSVNRTDRSVQFDQAKMFTDKIEQADRHFATTVGLKNRELDIKEGELQVKLAAAGKYRHVNPLTGEIELLDLTSGDSHLVTDDPNTEGVNVPTLGAVNEENTALKLENDKIAASIINKLVGEHPEVGVTEVTTIGKGTARLLKNQNFIEDFNGQPGLQQEDLAMFETTTDANGKPVYKYNDVVQKYGHLANLNSGQLQFIANQYKNYEALALGKGAVTPDLIDGFDADIEKMVMNNEVIRANNKKLNDIREQAYDDLNVPASAREGITKYINEHPEILSKSKSNAVGLMNQVLSYVGFLNTESPINGLANEVGRRINEGLKTTKTRDVYGIRTISKKDPFVSDGQLAQLISTDIANDKSEPYRNYPKLSNSDKLIEKSITPSMVGRASDGTGRYFVISDVEVGTGDKAVKTKYKTYINDSQANQMGIVRDPYENSLNYSVKINGRSSDIPLYGNKDMSIFVNVVDRNSSELNDNSSYAQAVVYYLDENGNKTNRVDRITIPATNGLSPSDAYNKAKQVVKLASQQGLTHEQFIEELRNYK